MSGSTKCILAPVVVGRNQTQILLVNEFELCPPAERIFDVKAKVTIDSFHICDDKVVFNATLKKEIIFCTRNCRNTDDDSDVSDISDVKCIVVTAPFDGFVEIPGTRPGDEVFVEFAGIEDDCIFEILKEDGRILQEKVIVLVDLKVIRNQQLTIDVCNPNICP